MMNKLIVFAVIAAVITVGVGIHLLKTPVREEEWMKEGVLISGGYCDAEVVKLDNGIYRMYYGTTPFMYEGKIEILSATSTDGLTWENEPGVRLSFGAMPSVIRLDNRSWRMYYSELGGICSAISDEDGLEFNDEGLRIAHYNNVQIRSSTVVRLDNGSYRMYYCEDDLGGFAGGQYIRSSISDNGLTWEKESGARIDGTQAPFYALAGGMVDGPDIVKLPNGSFRLYFWSGRSAGSKVEKVDGIYSADSEDGLNFSNISLILAQDELGVPSDPSVIQMPDGGWRMYYGLGSEICSAKAGSI